MPQKKFILTIPEPCHEQWSQMTVCGAGRFCGSCQKTVMDFTPLSNDSIVRILESSDGKICGRFQKSQLNRVVALTETHPSFFFSRMLKIAAGFLLPTVLHPAIAKAQMDVQKQNTVTQENAIGIHGADIKIHDNKEISDSAKNIISGIVIDEENKEALPFVSIWIEGTETGTTTDLEGRFILKVPIALISETEIKLVVSSIGYEKLFATIKTTDLPLKKKFVLKMNGCVTVGAVIVVKEVDMRPRLKGIPFVFK